MIEMLEIQLLGLGYTRITMPYIGQFFGVRIVRHPEMIMPQLVTTCRLCGEDAEVNYELVSRIVTTYCPECKTYISLTEEETDFIAGGTDAKL